MVNVHPQMAANLPSDLKKSNRRQILEFFRSGEAFTVGQIAQAIGVSRQTVMKAILHFTQKGLLASAGKCPSTTIGGKPPELYALSERRTLLSIALWPDQLHLAAMNLRGEVLCERRLDWVLPEQVAPAMEVASQLALEVLAGRDQLLGACISTSGIVDYATNTLKFNSLRPAWGRDVPLAKLMRPALGADVPILVENVAKVVGRSILHRQDLPYRRMISVFSSWGGVCASLMENEHILNGKNSLIGEIGHMIIAPCESSPCGCGNTGCFEQLVSRERINEWIAVEAAQHPETALQGSGNVSIEALFSASAAGDSFARELAARLGNYFAMAMRNISLVFDPELVVLQGEYAAVDECFLKSFQRSLADFQYYPEIGPFELQLDRRPIGELNLYGARALLIDHLLRDEALYA